MRSPAANYFDVSEKVCAFIDGTELELSEKFEEIDGISELNTYKVLEAFSACGVSEADFASTTGYGYGDRGRERLGEVFARVFACESAIVSPLLCSGTHAISTVLFGLLRPLDAMLCVTAKPYDTLNGVISGNGGLSEYAIDYLEQPPRIGGKLDAPLAVLACSKNPKIKVIYIQRSRGYSMRSSTSIQQIEEFIKTLREHVGDVIVVVDNCYGEFCENREPLEVGADIIVGSLIKNPGGGIAPTGGYIAGRADLIEKISMRLTAPGIGTEIGSYAHGYREFFLGLLHAPKAVGNALKGAVLTAAVFEKLGYKVFPKKDAHRTDIVQSIQFKTEGELTSFVRSVQASSPIDAKVVPHAWEMPGYADKVIMAAGTFIAGSSLELSADAPIREPYLAFLQGGLLYEQVKLAIYKACANKI